MPWRRASRLTLSAVLVSLLSLHWHATSTASSPRLPTPGAGCTSHVGQDRPPCSSKGRLRPAETRDPPQQEGPLTFIVYLKEETSGQAHDSHFTDHVSRLW